MFIFFFIIKTVIGCIGTALSPYSTVGQQALMKNNIMSSWFLVFIPRQYFLSVNKLQYILCTSQRPDEASCPLCRSSMGASRKLLQ